MELLKIYGATFKVASREIKGKWHDVAEDPGRGGKVNGSRHSSLFMNIVTYSKSLQCHKVYFFFSKMN